jgi:hypothetical protein
MHALIASSGGGVSWWPPTLTLRVWTTIPLVALLLGYFTLSNQLRYINILRFFSAQLYHTQPRAVDICPTYALKGFSPAPSSSFIYLS